MAAMPLFDRLYACLRCLAGTHRPVAGRVRRIGTHSWTGRCQHCGKTIRKDRDEAWRRWTPPPDARKL